MCKHENNVLSRLLPQWFCNKLLISLSLLLCDNIIYGIHRRSIFRNRRLLWMRPEPTTTEFYSDWLTDWSIKPWVDFALRANFVQLFQLHLLKHWVFIVLNLLNSCLSWTLGSLLKCSQLKSYFGGFSFELVQPVPLLYSQERSTRYFDWSYDFSIVFPRFYEDVYVSSFFAQLDTGILCL